MIDLIDIPVEALEMVDDTPFLARYFPNFFAEGLAPINPCRWPAFCAGSAMASEMPEAIDKIRTPFENLVVAQEYLATAKSDVQWRDRFWELTEDTFKVNAACEIGENVGSFAAGGAANKIADGYMDKMVTTSATLNPSESLNERIYSAFAEQNGYNANMVRGTGTMRQFVPQASRGDILNRPTRGSRPLWAYKHIKGGRGPLGFISPFICNQVSALKLAQRLLSNENYSIVKRIVVAYSYFRYVKFAAKLIRKTLTRIYKIAKNRAIVIRQKRKTLALNYLPRRSPSKYFRRFITFHN